MTIEIEATGTTAAAFDPWAHFPHAYVILGNGLFAWLVFLTEADYFEWTKGN